MNMANEVHVPINTDADLVVARQRGRALATELGFTSTDLTLIATAISEVTRNIVLYAGHGEVSLSKIQQGGRGGLAIVARDRGPGIRDLQQAMQDGFSTSG